MRKLETFDWWGDLIDLKDTLSLRELAERFEVTPGAISAALRRTDTMRRAAPPGPRAARPGRIATDELPPEPEFHLFSRPVPVDRPAPGRNQAWQVVVRSERGDRLRVVVAPSVVDAARLAARAGGGEIVGLSWVGEMVQV